MEEGIARTKRGITLEGFFLSLFTYDQKVRESEVEDEEFTFEQSKIAESVVFMPSVVPFLDQTKRFGITPRESKARLRMNHLCRNDCSRDG